TPYGVRIRRIGSGPVFSFGVKMTVCNFTPSRTGIMTSSRTKRSCLYCFWTGGGGACAVCCACATGPATSSRIRNRVERVILNRRAELRRTDEQGSELDGSVGDMAAKYN